MTEFFQRLKQRKLVQWAIAYVAAAFALLQGIDIVAQQFAWPEGVRRGITLALVVGFFLTLILAWYHGERGAQRVTGTELLIIGLVLALGGGFLWRFAGATRTPAEKAVTTPNDNRMPEPARAIPAKSIAVLPFENLSSDQENAYFAEGVQDEILNRLAKVADLKVISRTSTQRFQSAPNDLREIAQQLRVANILQGSVQKASDQVRVNVQLINAETDAHLWGDTYDRRLTDIFAVESDIAKTIAETLQAKLTGSEKSSIAKVPLVNPEAYELYLKGRFFWNKRTGEDLRKSIDYYNQAIARDPSYALAYAGLADSYLLLPTYGGISSAESIPPARAAAKKALELDDSLAEAHASAGLLATYDYEPNRGIMELERAIQIKPNYATAHHWLAFTLMILARFDRAIAEQKRAIELDPLSLIINTDLSWVYLNARRYDDAEAQARKALEIDSRFFRAHYRLGAALQLQGHIAKAILEYQKAIEVNDDPYSIAVLGQAYARNGQVDEARKVLARLNEEAKSRYVPPYGLALIQLALDNKESALDELERGYQEGSASYMYLIKVDPFLDDLRGQPRFEALVQKIVGPK